MKPYLKSYPSIERVYDVLIVDTEFTRLPMVKEAVWSWAAHCRVLSVGIVPLDDAGGQRSFYATRKLTRQVLSQCVPFVIETVIPRLDDAVASAIFSQEAELGLELNHYLDERRRASGKAPLLAVDWIGDAYLLNPLMRDEPNWLLVEGIAQIEHALGEGWPEGRSRHNALHDALSIRDGYRAFLQAPVL